jgi:hypothetical protein
LSNQIIGECQLLKDNFAASVKHRLRIDANQRLVNSALLSVFDLVSSSSFSILPTTCSYSSSVGKLDQAGSPASACTGLYRQKGKINPGDTGSHPKHLHIRRDTKTKNNHLPVLDQMVFLNIF